jgi:hypothetical protein
MPPSDAKRSAMEVFVLLAVLAGWFVLQMWVLPRMGVSS